MKSYKIAHLSIAFVLLVALSVAVMLGLVLRHMESLSDEQDRYEKNEAKKELRLAILNLNAQLDKVQNNINDWGETKQQYINREFYQIWKELRVSDSGKLPPEVDQLALYDDQGKIFGTPSKKKPLPLTIIKGQPYLQKYTLNDGEYWLYVFPISGVDLTGLNENKKIILGYASVIFSLKKILSGLTSFKFIDVDSVATTYTNKTIFTLDHVNEFLSYDVKADVYRKELIKRPIMR